jgi:hypothetical protein
LGTNKVSHHIPIPRGVDEVRDIIHRL